MAGRNRIVTAAAVAMFLLGLVMAISSTGYAAGKNSVVTGIVGYVRGDVVTVAGRTYDLKGARFQDGKGAPLAKPIDLRGQTLEILFRNGKIDTVTVYRTLPQ